jgi:hypothetical protein
MTFTYEELKKKSLEELKELAKGIEHDAVKGFTQMNKEHLLPGICAALGIDTRVHHVVIGIDKAAIKAKIQQLKTERDKALGAHDHKRLKRVRRQIHTLKRRIHAATV